LVVCMEEYQMSYRLRIGAVSAMFFMLAAPGFSSAIRNPTGSGANTLAANDDGSTAAVSLGFLANFFGASSSTVFVNNNGNVTFTSPLSQFTPNGLPTGVGQPIIAPFFADVDTRGVGSGLVTYGTGTITDASLGWNNAPEFAVEWPAVGYYLEHVDKINTFELILVDRSDTGAGNFDIEFNYSTIKWETGDASGGSNGFGGTPAAVGYSNGLSGASNQFFQVTGSLVSGALLDGGPNALITHDINSSVLGRYDLQVRGGTVIPPPPDTPEPGTWLLLAGGITSLGFVRLCKRA
jgi:Nidogen-like